MNEGREMDRPELRPLLSVLKDGGVSEHAMRTWLTNPSSLLSGEVPENVALTEPARALHAAKRFAAL